MKNPAWFWEVSITGLVTDHPVKDFNDNCIIDENLTFSLMENLRNESTKPEKYKVGNNYRLQKLLYVCRFRPY